MRSTRPRTRGTASAPRSAHRRSTERLLERRFHAHRDFEGGGDRASGLRALGRFLERGLIDSRHLPAHLERGGLHFESPALLGPELDGAGGVQTLGGVSALRQRGRERHAEAARMRRRQQFLRSSVAGGPFSAGLPAQVQVAEGPAAGVGLALARHQIAFPLRRCAALHDRSSLCRRLLADGGHRGNSGLPERRFRYILRGWFPGRSRTRPTPGSPPRWNTSTRSRPPSWRSTRTTPARFSRTTTAPPWASAGASTHTGDAFMPAPTAWPED